MRYVTYYNSLLGGLSDIIIHDNQDKAIKYYRQKAHSYFYGLRLPKKTTTPTACGFPHRMFGVMSLTKFRRAYPEYKTLGGRT